MNASLLYTVAAGTTEGDSGIIWFFVIVLACLVLIFQKKGSKRLRQNECPKCHHDTLETRSKFFGGSYRRCKRFFCPYDERKLAREQKRDLEERQRTAQKRARWEAEHQYRRDREEDMRAAILYEQQKQREREERSR